MLESDPAAGRSGPPHTAATPSLGPVLPPLLPCVKFYCWRNGVVHPRSATWASTALAENKRGTEQVVEEGVLSTEGAMMPEQLRWLLFVPLTLLL